MSALISNGMLDRDSSPSTWSRRLAFESEFASSSILVFFDRTTGGGFEYGGILDLEVACALCKVVFDAEGSGAVGEFFEKTPCSRSQILRPLPRKRVLR